MGDFQKTMPLSCIHHARDMTGRRSCPPSRPKFPLLRREFLKDTIRINVGSPLTPGATSKQEEKIPHHRDLGEVSRSLTSVLLADLAREVRYPLSSCQSLLKKVDCHPGSLSGEVSRCQECRKICLGSRRTVFPSAVVSAAWGVKVTLPPVRSPLTASQPFFKPINTQQTLAFMEASAALVTDKARGGPRVPSHGDPRCHVQMLLYCTSPFEACMGSKTYIVPRLVASIRFSSSKDHHSSPVTFTLPSYRKASSTETGPGDRYHPSPTAFTPTPSKRHGDTQGKRRRAHRKEGRHNDRGRRWHNWYGYH
jgi:hypothetical protein